MEAISGRGVLKYVPPALGVKNRERLCSLSLSGSAEGQGQGCMGQAGQEGYFSPGFVPSLPHWGQGCGARGAAPLCFL